MKKALISIAAVTFIALMISNAHAVVMVPPPTVPPPSFCGCLAPGFTPGFWKHDIKVRIGLTNGAYNAFEGGQLDGVKLTNALMDSYLAAIKAQAPGMSGLTFAQALAFLELPGWDPNRTNMANWFNKVAGYGPF